MVNRKYSVLIVEQGIDLLIKHWQGLVNSLSDGKSYELDNYKFYIESRGLLADLLHDFPELKETEYFEKITKLDFQFREITKPTFAGVWNRDDRNKFWFYYRIPEDSLGEGWPELA